MIAHTNTAAAITWFALASSAVAQFPAAPVGVTVLESRFGEGVTISYKEVYTTPAHIV